MLHISARNRFNLRGSVSTSSTESTPAETNSVSPVRSGSRPRPPSFHNRRQHQKPTVANDESISAPETNESAASAENIDGAAVSTTPRSSSRFNIGRPNRLLPGARRGRPTENNASGEVAADAAVAPAVTNVTENSSDAAEASTTQSGLNRLKKRPRIQLNTNKSVGKSANATSTASTPSSVTSAPVRKLNPLLARRKFAGGQSTTTTTQGEITVFSNFWINFSNK